jgi:hypothetical protein
LIQAHKLFSDVHHQKDFKYFDCWLLLNEWQLADGNEKRKLLIGSVPAESTSFEKKAKVLDVQLDPQSEPLIEPKMPTWLPQSIASLPPAKSGLLPTFLLQQQAMQQQQQQQQQQLLTLQWHQRHGLAQGTPLTSVASPSSHLQSALPDTSVHMLLLHQQQQMQSILLQQSAILNSLLHQCTSAARFPSSCRST